MMQISRRHFIGGVMAACLAASAATPDMYVDWVGNAADASCYVNQYVDTGVNAQSGTKAEFEIEFAVVDQDHSVLDARYDSSNSGRFYLLHLYHSHFSLGYGEFLEITTHTVQPDTRYHVISVLETGHQSMVVTNLVTGEEVVNYTASKTPTYNFNTNIYLLACNYNNSYYYTCRARLYGVKIWQKGEGDADYNDANLMRDYRPCMYSGKYEFHEKVSDTLVEGKVKESGSSSNALRLRGPASSPICVDGPPDYLLDYVAGSGKGVIDTGVPGRTGIRVVTDMEWRTASGEKCYLGNYAADRGLGRFYVIHKAFPVGGVTQSVWTAYGDAKRGYPTNILTGTFAPAYPYRRYRYEADYTDPANVTLSLDGEYLSLVPDGSTTNLVADSADYRVATTNLTVLGCNWGSQGLAWFSYARCYTLKMWEDGVLVRDFLPCLKDGVAGLWNQVDNKIYMPLGKTVAGSVTNDVPLCVHEPDRYLDYIQSTGTEYINTGVRGRSDTMAEIEMEWCEVGSDWSFLDARGSINHDTTPNSRFFLWHTSLAKFAYGYVDYARQDHARAAANTRYHVVTELAKGRQTLTVNDQLIASGSDSRVVDAGCNLYVFVANIGDSTPSYFSKARLYRLKLWQKATDETDYVLLRDFRPAIAKDGTIGLWDLVGQRFYPSAGTPFALNGAQTTGRVNAGGVIMVR